jgi:hypothetical protein
MLEYPHTQVQHWPIGESSAAKIPLVEVVLEAAEVVVVLLVAAGIEEFPLRHMDLALLLWPLVLPLPSPSHA